MLVRLFQIIFGKLIGLDRISPEKKEKYAEFALKLASEAIKAGAEGAAKGIAESAGEKLKYDIRRVG